MPSSGAALNEIIKEVNEGSWRSPTTGVCAPIGTIADLRLLEDELPDIGTWLGQLGFSGTKTAIVCGGNGFEVLGRNIEKSLTKAGMLGDVIVFEKRPQADFPHLTKLKEHSKNSRLLLSVGSGTITDLCKYASFLEQKPFCAIGTAASMDAYTSASASIRLENGLKASLKAHAATAVLLPVNIMRSAPEKLASAGFADVVCKSVARTDWWLSHRLLGTDFSIEAYEILERDFNSLMEQAALIPEHHFDAIASLARSLTLSGLGGRFTGSSHHASMSEHQISHYIDCFAPKTSNFRLHGHQVGIASISMARLQRQLLEQEDPPVLKAEHLDQQDLVRRLGSETAQKVSADYQEKLLDQAKADALNRRLEAIWPELRLECLAICVKPEVIKERLKQAGAPTNFRELGLDDEFYREAVLHAHELRNRYGFVDLAAASGQLERFAQSETCSTTAGTAV